MALSGTVKAEFPNVPIAAGVPAVARAVGAVASAVNTITAAIRDPLSILGFFTSPQWGLFDQGFPALTSDSIYSVEFRRDKRISTAPQEQGAFASYNKVADPFQGRITYLQGGGDSDRGVFLQQCFALQDTLTLFDLVMPDFVFPSVNVTHVDFKRTSRRGMTLLQVDLWVEEVRVTGTAEFTKTETASGASTTSAGSATPETPSATVTKAASGTTSASAAEGRPVLPAGAVT